MIYIDTSVAMAEIMTEARRPATGFWHDSFVSSDLLRFEVWNRLHAYGAKKYRHERARRVLGIVDFVEMSVGVLARALHPFPHPVRTLDGLHLATLVHLREAGASIELASYDARLNVAAEALGFRTIAP